MTPETLLSNHYVTLWFHPEDKIVHHQMHGFVPEALFREFLLAGVERMRREQACKWLSDDRRNPVLAASLHEWARDHWFPQAVAAGWKFWAIVQPEDMLGQWSMERAVMDYRAQGIVARYFGDPDSAMQWLRQQPQAEASAA